MTDLEGYRQMMERVKALPKDQLEVLKGFYNLDSDHHLVQFAERLQASLKKVIKK